MASDKKILLGCSYNFSKYRNLSKWTYDNIPGILRRGTKFRSPARRLKLLIKVHARWIRLKKSMQSLEKKYDCIINRQIVSERYVVMKIVTQFPGEITTK